MKKINKLLLPKKNDWNNPEIAGHFEKDVIDFIPNIHWQDNAYEEPDGLYNILDTEFKRLKSYYQKEKHTSYRIYPYIYKKDKSLKIAVVRCQMFEGFYCYINKGFCTAWQLNFIVADPKSVNFIKERTKENEFIQ